MAALALLGRTTAIAGLMLAAWTISPRLADAQSGATVLRSSPVGIINIDNPCTPQVESLTLIGFLQEVITPGGTIQFHSLLKTEGYNIVEVFITRRDQNTYFNELLISLNGQGNFLISGVRLPDGTIQVTGSSCVGS
jgi:hypothetical protein